MASLMCSVYRSSKRDEMYLYVRKGTRLERLPEALLQQFGKAVPVMDFLLSPERRLARADAGKVLAQIEAQDFYLQMPPNPLVGTPPDDTDA